MLGSCWPLGRFLGHFFSFLGTSVFEVAFGSDFFRFRIEFGRILARFGKDFADILDGLGVKMGSWASKIKRIWEI